ncbi:MAG TPA: hypothetical protein DCF49_00025, partial [Lachnospiraceae bacterium]|nr:hypothetical protein [Lachnospiraceae bacterium]
MKGVRMNYRQVRSILLKNGWKRVRKEGSHEQYKKAGNPNLVTLVKHAVKRRLILS